MRKLVVAITGASGSIYAERFLSTLLQIKDQWMEVSVVMTENARTVWRTELGRPYVPSADFKHFELNDFQAPFASGSSQYDTMVILPCSMGTLGRIAHGISSDLISRAADVMLKERRKLICVIRETPLSLVHIQNMQTLTLAGAIICPAAPSFYSRPTSLAEIADTVVHRVADLSGLDVKSYRWGTGEK